MKAIPALLAMLLICAGCPSNRPVEPPAAGGPGAGTAGELRLLSDGFLPNQPIPPRYTADGQNVSPPMLWTGMPAAAKELALVMHDPDAPQGPFIHWIVYRIAPTTRYLPEGMARDSQLASGIRQGTNSFRKIGYDGPAPPPPDARHRYIFRLYALNAPLELKAGATIEDFNKAIEGKVIEQAELVGTYDR